MKEEEEKKEHIFNLERDLDIFLFLFFYFHTKLILMKLFDLQDKRNKIKKLVFVVVV